MNDADRLSVRPRSLERPALAHRGIQIDLGRVIERPDTVKRLIDVYASLNINVLQLYLENALVFPSHPELARRFAWTIEQAMDVVDHARAAGIDVIPAIQSLGHCAWVGEHPDYRELDEGFDGGRVTGVLCPSHPRTLEMIEQMVRDVAPLATSGIIHLGMDESFVLGRCKRCAPRRAEIGEGGIYLAHANRVASFARSVGKRPAIWGDMFYYHPDQVPRLDKDMLIFDWYYYAFDRFPRIELFNFAEIDSRKMWHDNGLESWGCPWSVCSVVLPYNQPSQSIENARNWRRYLDSNDDGAASGMMITQWELAPNDIDLATPIEAAMAMLTWEADADASADELLARACDHLYGRPRLGALIERLSEYRFHGHCARRWLYAESLGAMLTYADAERDRIAAREIAQIRESIVKEIRGARHEDHLHAFVISAQWLEYQYGKRAAVNEAGRDAAAGRWDEARRRLQPLASQARELAAAWQALWDQDRYPGDPAPTPRRLLAETEMFAGPLDSLAKPVLLVHVTNSHPGAVAFGVATSVDGITFNEHGSAWMIEMDNRAARPRSDEELSYAFAIDRPEDARFVRITALGCGRFALRGASVRHGTRQWDASAGKSPKVMGHPDARAAFHEMLAAGDASRVFTIDNGHVVLELVEST